MGSPGTGVPLTSVVTKSSARRSLGGEHCCDVALVPRAFVLKMLHVEINAHLPLIFARATDIDIGPCAFKWSSNIRTPCQSILGNVLCFIGLKPSVSR